jgi:hypothetical protein
MEQGLVRGTKAAARLVSAIMDRQTTHADITARLEWARDYINDNRWCLKMSQLCGLEDVRFSSKNFLGYELVIEFNDEGLLDHPVSSSS